jgi:glycosyltransferase involved in cell wall biosynthesis
MTTRLVIITEIIAPYRIPVFNALAERPEVDLHVIFLSENDPTLRQWRVYKDEIKFQYDVLPSWRRRLGGYNILLNRGVHAALKRIEPHVLLCGGYNYLASWQAAYWARRHRVPLLLWSESTAFDRRRGYRSVEFIKTCFLNLCAAFVVPGKSSFNYLQDLGIAGQRIFTAPNAVDTSLFSQSAEAARQSGAQRRPLPQRYFLCVGRLVKAKGIFDLVEAYGKLDAEVRSQIGLVFAGDGSDAGELQQRAARTMPGTIQILGFTHREELPALYALADAFVFPTHSDPWGLVVNEAMACSLPVIVTNVAGCALDLVQDGWNGFVVQPGDPLQLAAAMARLAGNSSLRAEMGAHSRERVDAYSPATWAAGIVEAACKTRNYLLNGFG